MVLTDSASNITPKSQKEAERKLFDAVEGLKNCTKEYKIFNKAVRNGLRAYANEFSIGDADVKSVSFNYPGLEMLVEIDHPEDERDLIMGIPISVAKEYILDGDYFAYDNDEEVRLRTEDFLCMVEDKSVGHDDITNDYLGDLEANIKYCLASISAATTKRGFLKLMENIRAAQEYSPALRTLSSISPGAKTHEDIYVLASGLEKEILTAEEKEDKPPGTDAVSKSRSWVYNMFDTLKEFDWRAVKNIAKKGAVMGAAAFYIGSMFGGFLAASEDAAAQHPASGTRSEEIDTGQLEDTIVDITLGLEGGNPDIFGERVVWTEGPAMGKTDIYMKEAGPDGKFGTSDDVRSPVCTNPARQLWPRGYDNIVVWGDYRNDADGTYKEDGGVDGMNIIDLYGRNQSGEEFIVYSNKSSADTRPSIFGKNVAWEHRGPNSTSIMVKNIETGKIKKLTDRDSRWPSIYEDNVAYLDYFGNTIYTRNVNTGEINTEIKKQGDDFYSIDYLKFYGDNIVWTEEGMDGLWAGKSTHLYLKDNLFTGLSEVKKLRSWSGQETIHIYPGLSEKVIAYGDVLLAGKDGALGSEDDVLLGDLLDNGEATGRLHSIYGKNIIWLMGKSNGFNIKLVDVNKYPPPEIFDIDSQFMSAGETLELKIEAKDKNGDPITFSDNSALFDVDSRTGEIYFEPEQNDFGKYKIRINASDGRWYSSKDFQLEVNGLPRFTNLPDTLEARVGEDFAFDVNATDPESDELYYDARGTDSPLVMRGGTGELHTLGTLTQDDVGIYRIKIKVTDERGYSFENAATEKEITFVVKEKESKESEDADGGEGAALPAEAFCAGILALLGGAGLGLYIRRRRKSKPPKLQPRGKPQAGQASQQPAYQQASQQPDYQQASQQSYYPIRRSHTSHSQAQPRPPAQTSRASQPQHLDGKQKSL